MAATETAKTALPPQDAMALAITTAAAAIAAVVITAAVPVVTAVATIAAITADGMSDLHKKGCEQRYAQ